jgi:hypothetical protein
MVNAVANASTPLVDLDGDGIDDRVEVRPSWSRSLAEWTSTRLAKPCTSETSCERAPSSISTTVAELRRVPNSVVPRWPGRSTKTSAGYEYIAPRASVIAQLVGTDLDELSLAVALASESLMAYPQYGLLVGDAIMNECAVRGISPYHRITMDGIRVAGSPAPAAGHFGRQSGRWCSSFQPATLRSLSMARALLSGRGAGLARAARRWIDPKVQDGGRQASQRLKLDAVGIVRKWAAEGWRPIDGPILDGNGKVLIDPYRLLSFEFLGRGEVSEIELDRAEASIRDGRIRWNVYPRHATSR